MSTLTAPTPNVQHVPTVLRRIQTGDILVPAFQRNVVWKPGQILELIRSVYLGFPVGSLLLWKVEDEEIDPGRLMGPPFPRVEPKNTRHYVLDGQQRLAALFGALYGQPDHPDRFRVAFDLRKQAFDFERMMPKDGAWLYLSELFSPKDFLAAQKRLSELKGSDDLLDRAVTLHTVFQEYMLPIVTIENRSIEDVVQIFERINNTGTKLDTVDFMRAVTWSKGFDLNKQIRRLHSAGEDLGFKFDSEALVRVLAIVLGRRPVSEDMLTLRKLDAKQLRRGVDNAIRRIKDAVKYFKTQLKIFSADFVPYEAQLLVVVKLFSSSEGMPSPSARRRVASWFLASTLNEEFQGKPDHSVARIIDSVDDLVAKRADLLHTDVVLHAGALMERRFLKRKALSGAVAMLMAQSGARSLLTGEPIEPSLYMTRSDPDLFVPIIDRDALNRATKRNRKFSKFLANLVLAGSSREAEKLESAGIMKTLLDLKRVHGKAASEILESQMIPPEGIAALQANRIADFLRIRADAILAKAGVLTRGR